MATIDTAAALWTHAGLATDSLERLELPETEPLFPTSFTVAEAAQATIGVAALAAAELGARRNGHRSRGNGHASPRKTTSGHTTPRNGHTTKSGHTNSVRVERQAAERECSGLFRLDGTVPNQWAPFSGLYATADGHVRIHANFDHHRDGALGLLGLDHRSAAREDVTAALAGWRAEDFESSAAKAGLVVAAARTFEEWDTHPQALAARDLPPLRLTRIDSADPRPWDSRAVQRQSGREGGGSQNHGTKGHTPPLSGLRVLELTRILAGPVAGRTLATYGADVLLLNAPYLPNIDSIVETSRGKRSALIDLKSAAGHDQMRTLVRDSDVLLQGYRPGGIADLGFGPEAAADVCPGIVYASLSAYGSQGPWRERRGFDSLVQTATGFNLAEAQAANEEAPRGLPVQILDYASGYLLAFGIQAALLRQLEEGGSWHVEISLLGTANWLRSLGRDPTGMRRPQPKIRDHLRSCVATAGRLEALPHAASIGQSALLDFAPSRMPGDDQPEWP
ncbi:MAG: CoA transferase [Pseudomonadota bacterium]